MLRLGGSVARLYARCQDLKCNPVTRTLRARTPCCVRVARSDVSIGCGMRGVRCPMAGVGSLRASVVLSKGPGSLAVSFGGLEVGSGMARTARGLRAGNVSLFSRPTSSVGGLFSKGEIRLPGGSKRLGPIALYGSPLK